MVQSIPPDMIRLVLDHVDECKITLEKASLAENSNRYVMKFASEDCNFSIHFQIDSRHNPLVIRDPLLIGGSREVLMIGNTTVSWKAIGNTTVSSSPGTSDILYELSLTAYIRFDGNYFVCCDGGDATYMNIKIPKRYNKKMQEFIETKICSLKYICDVIS